jgi:hypothetical protein
VRHVADVIGRDAIGHDRQVYGERSSGP